MIPKTPWQELATFEQLETAIHYLNFILVTHSIPYQIQMQPSDSVVGEYWIEFVENGEKFGVSGIYQSGDVKSMFFYLAGIEDLLTALPLPI